MGREKRKGRRRKKKKKKKTMMMEERERQKTMNEIKTKVITINKKKNKEQNEKPRKTERITEGMMESGKEKLATGMSRSKFQGKRTNGNERLKDEQI